MIYARAITILFLAFNVPSLCAQFSMGGMGSMMSGMGSLMGMRGGGMSSMMGGRGGMMGGMGGGSMGGMGGGSMMGGRGGMMGGMGGGSMMGGRGGMMGGMSGGGMMGGRGGMGGGGGMMFNLLGPQSSYTLTLLNQQQMLRSRRDAVRAPISVPATVSRPMTESGASKEGSPSVPLPRFNGQRRDLRGGRSPN